MLSYKIGAAEVMRVEETIIRRPIATIADHRVVAQNASWLSPHFLDLSDDSFGLVMQSWIIRVDGITIVVDPCNGNGRKRPGMPFFADLQTLFFERFVATGTDPADVDLVFCTHLHCDHCGWNTQRSNGRWVPTFPRARYKLVREEFEYRNPARPNYVSGPYDAGVWEDSIQPIIDAGLVDLVTSDHQLSPSLQVQSAPGHTVAHAMLQLTSNTSNALFTGDVFHHPLQIARPEIDMGSESTPQALSTRYAVAERLATTGALVVAAHFEAPHVGYVRRSDRGFWFDVAPDRTA